MRRATVLSAAFAVILLASGCSLENRLSIYLPSRAVNARGGDLTIRNARIWTGDPACPWATGITVKDGRIVALNADNPVGKVIDAGGRLMVPGLGDGHAHPQAPYVLFSPEAPMLFGARTPQEVLERLRAYVDDHPEDKFPRLFGWMGAIFKEGEKPTRQMIDAVVSDRPVYLVHNGGHSHWVNTKALELAGALEKDPPGWCGDGRIERDSSTGLATGFLEETEYAATHGVMLNAVRKAKPYTFREQTLLQRAILEEYPKLGVTSIWTKDGDPEITDVYEQILREDALPVRAVLDSMYTPYSKIEDIAAIARRAEKLRESGLPPDFLRSDCIKLFLDLPIEGWIWMFEPYADGSGRCGKPAFPVENFRAQMIEADRLGLQINVSIYGDRALHECLNLMEETARLNGSRDRRFMMEHAQYIKEADLPRFRQLGVIASMNPIVCYPDEGFQKSLEATMGAKRLHDYFQLHKDLIRDGAIVVNGSDFPLAPMDPLVGIHILVTGKDIDGKPEGGWWPHKCITVEEALRTYTSSFAYATFAEGRRGILKVGYDADFVVLSDDILSDRFPKDRLAWVKACLTVMNGHVMHEDFSAEPKKIEFAK